MSNRRIPRDRNTSRSKATKTPKPEIVVVCEGANTEPNYLADFSCQYGNKLVRVTCIPGAGAPVTIVNKAVDIRKNLVRKARREKNSFDSLFQVWAVFDIDEHPNIDRAVDKARANKISVARSNPCFEIWPLLHIRSHTGCIHRHDLQKLLGDEMPNYKPENAKNVDYQSIKDMYPEACKRADKLLDMHVEVDTPFGNPSTEIHNLLKQIEEYGNKK